MKSTVFAVSLCAVLLVAVSASADTISLTPSPSDLDGLDHSWCYKWGLRNANASQIIITGASLSFDNIYNWKADDPNMLFIHLLDSDGEQHPAGDYNTVTRFNDTVPTGMSDEFSGQGIELVTYTDLSSTAQDITYIFSIGDIATLNQYLQNGNDFALAFDPDCHFYNDGVELNLEYGVAPEPGSMALIGFGGMMMLGKLRRRRRCQ